jgi:sulfate adenylyltransferase large subunit
MAEDLKFIIVGHVDHGKSTLIGRLLYDTDALPKEKLEEIKMICDSLGKEFDFSYIMDSLDEEREQNVTIDISQVFFRTKQRDYVIIDSPGHVEFVKNMITGASQAEAAILIVDAEEGMKEQTRRHAYILNMLGLKQIIVAVNKMDAIGYSKDKFDSLKVDITNFLHEINLNPNYIIPISAREGDFVAKKSQNLSWYSGPTLLEALDSFHPRISNNLIPLRFAIQDVYKVDKRIAVGKVESGIIKKGQEITILPSMEKTSVVSIEKFLEDNVQDAISGEEIGIVTRDKVFIDRGNIITGNDNLPKVTSEFKAHIFWLDKQPLKEKERVIFRCATQEVPCEISEFVKIINSSTLEEIKGNELKIREVADVIIKTESPVVIEDFNKVQELGRFVIERGNIVAGGIITRA